MSLPLPFSIYLWLFQSLSEWGNNFRTYSTSRSQLSHNYHTTGQPGSLGERSTTRTRCKLDGRTPTYITYMLRIYCYSLDLWDQILTYTSIGFWLHKSVFPGPNLYKYEILYVSRQKEQTEHWLTQLCWGHSLYKASRKDWPLIFSGMILLFSLCARVLFQTSRLWL